jgi:ABC-type transport system involved in Fe-S cluster assembly fused permease/ATPase subunit
MVDTLAVQATAAVDRLRNRLDYMIVRYDAWFLVLLAVLLVLAFAFLVAMSIWCLTQAGGRRFTGKWDWSRLGISMWVECI